MLQGISAVAFDLDGTLYPNHSLYIRLAPFMLRHGLLVTALGRARNTIRRKQEQAPQSFLPDFYEYQAQITARILKKPADQVRKTIDDLIYRGWERHFEKIKLFPHARELLTELQTTPLKRGLLSDFPPKVKLEQLGISGCWDAVLCSEDTGALKPSVRPFAELAKTLDCPAEQVLYVGNSYRYDIVGARRAGMKSALLINRFSSGRFAADADFTFHDYRQLRDFMLL